MTELTRVSSLRRISSSRTAMRKLARTGHSFTRLPSRLSTTHRPVKKNNLNVLVEESTFVDKNVLQDDNTTTRPKKNLNIFIEESTLVDEYGFDTTADVADDSSVKTSKVTNGDIEHTVQEYTSAANVQPTDSPPPSLTKISSTSLRRVGSTTAMKHRAVSLARNGSRLTRRTGSRLNRTGSRFNHTVRRAISPTTKLPTSQEQPQPSEGLLSEDERAKLWNDVDQLVVNESLLLMNDNNHNQSKEEYDIPIWFKNDSMDGLVSVKTNPTIEEEESEEDIVKKESEMNVVVEDSGENQNDSGSGSTGFFSCGGGLEDVWSCIRIDGVVLDDNATDEGVITNDIAMDDDTPVSEVVQDENKQVLDNISSSINNNENAKYWKQMVDGTTSKTYYYNKKTNEVSWSKPIDYGNETWKIAKDTTTGKTYYNKQTKMVQWDKPDVLFKNGKEEDIVMSVEKKKEEEGWGWPNVNTFGGILSSRMH